MLAVFLAIAVAVGAAGAPSTASPSQIPPGRGDDDDGPTVDATIGLIQQDATVAPDGDFTAFLEVVGAPPGSDLAVDIYPVIDTEERLEAALAGAPNNSEATFPVVTLPDAVGSTPVQTGFVMNFYAPGEPSPGGGWAMRLDEAGVYPVRVRLRGPDSSTLDTLVTYVVRRPTDEEDDRDPVSLALLSEVASAASPTDHLETTSAPLSAEQAGNLEALVDTFGAHPDVPATFVVPTDVARSLAITGDADAETDPDGNDGDQDEPDEPETTSTSDPSTSTSRTEGSGTGPDGDTTSTTGAPEPPTSDGTLLERFRAVLAGGHRELLANPFVDVDPTDLVRAGLEVELDRQFDRGFRDLAEVLEAPTSDTWLVRHRLDPATVDALARVGLTSLLVPPRSLLEPSTLPATARGSSGQTHLVVVDPTLTTGGTSDPALAAQRLFAHSLARSIIDDGAPQIVSVPAPESVDDIAEIDAFLALIEEHTDLMQPTSVSEIIAATPTAEDRAVLAAPEVDPFGSYPADLKETRRLLDAYASMVPDRPDLPAAVADQLSRSAAAGLSPAQRDQLVGDARSHLESRFAQVTIPSSDRVTLGARDAQFPLVISSSSDVPVRVIVDLASASDRLTVQQERIEVLLDGDRTVVPVAVHSRSPGDTPIRITVTSLDGQVILSEGTYSVRSTAVSGVGLLLTVGAGLFLAVWWGRHFLRARKRRARHAR